MTNPHLHISVTFWGENYRRYFVDYCLASLLAPGNIPAISDKSNARLLIATTDADWQAMQSEPVFRAARAHIAIEHIAHNVDGAGLTREQVMGAMSTGHRLLADRMFAARAHGVFVYPDSIVADGAVVRLQELARQGVKVVMCLAVRFANEGLIHELHESGLWLKGAPLTLDAAALARMSITHMHSATRRSEFDAQALDYGAGAYFWTVAPGQDLLFHVANWAPMLIDYGALADHDTSTFARWTLDGDYIQRNFPDPRDFYIVQNTRELFISGFTPEGQIHHSLAPFPPYRVGWLRNWLKIGLARHHLITRGLFDPLKIDFFSRPIRMQGGDSPDAAWLEAERGAAPLVKRMKGEQPSLLDPLVNASFEIAFRLYIRVRSAALRRRQMAAGE